ncbi:hypothetical protein Lal_00040360 [Lupinus albus]|nr:hypothetical protein Lal_00040360 [Lupinus albus]
MISKSIIDKDTKGDNPITESSIHKEVVWLAPLPNSIKINFDGAAKGAPGLAGGGSIFRDHNGEFLGGFADFFGIKDALFAELQAALKAIQIAHHKG